MLKELKITNNINLAELMPDQTLENLEKLANKLQLLRDFLQKPIYINTPKLQARGFRTYNQNIAIGGAEKSFHLSAQAADVSWSDFKQADTEIHQELKKHFKCIIWYPKHVHVDLRGYDYINLHATYT